VVRPCAVSLINIYIFVIRFSLNQPPKQLVLFDIYSEYPFGEKSGNLMYFLCFFVVLGFISSAMADGAKIDRPIPVENEVQRSGIVRVIVEFKIDSSNYLTNKTLKPGSKEIEAYSRLIRDGQNSVLSGIRNYDRINIVKNSIPYGSRLYSMIPLLGVTVDRNGLSSLLDNNNVVRISYDEKYYSTLQDSVPMIGMTGQEGAFNKGADGRGKIIAVIDTGVDYYHEFLKNKLTSGACFSMDSLTSL